MARYMRARLLDAGGGLLAGVLTGVALDRMAQQHDEPAAVPTAASIAQAQFARWGLPVHESLSVKSGYCSAVDYRLRIPSWVCEHLSQSESAAEGVSRDRSNFHEDADVPRIFRSSNADYKNSGYSRGHLAPAGSHKNSQQALDETFLLSANIVPQEMSNNGSDWLRLERFVQSLVERHDDVWGQSLGVQPIPSTVVAPDVAC